MATLAVGPTPDQTVKVATFTVPPNRRLHKLQVHVFQRFLTIFLPSGPKFVRRLYQRLGQCVQQCQAPAHPGRIASTRRRTQTLR